MGEATHGTKEFFQMKHRMLEFLVEKMDFRLFGIEACFGDCEIVNDYVLYGKGKAEDAVHAMQFWTWSTNEVLDMVKWMRNFNKNPKNKRKIKFYGFDMQSSQVSKKIVVEYLNKVDIYGSVDYEQRFYEYFDSKIGSLKENELTIIKNNIKDLISKFEKSKVKYVSKSSNSEYEKIHQHLNTILQYLNLQNSDLIKTCNIRDKYMAQNVKWILDYEKQFGNNKIMLWAHNGHVSKQFDLFTCMGSHLKRMYNNDMYVIGFDFYKGSFRAKDEIEYKLKKFTIANSKPSTFATKLQSVNVPLYFMDFKSNLKNKAINELLCKSQFIHHIGAVYSEEDPLQGTYAQVPINSFDGIIFISNTSAAVGIK